MSIDKCLRGANRKKLDPGKYTVIMEPAAVADLIGWLGFAFGASEAEQGQSFLSKPREGKNGRRDLSGREVVPGDHHTAERSFSSEASVNALGTFTAA